MEKFATNRVPSAKVVSCTCRSAVSQRNPVIAWVATVLVLVGGYMSYERLGRFEDPEFVIREAVVVRLRPV